MDRRTLLKSAAATLAVGGIGSRRLATSAASNATGYGPRARLAALALPAQWEILDLWANDTWISGNGQNWIGTVRDIANNGYAVGEVVMDGRLQPVIWDPSRTMTVLDMGSHDGESGVAGGINSQGLASGALSPAEALYVEGTQMNLDEVPLIWRNGQLVDMSGILPPDTLVSRLSESGLFTGTAADAPGRWDLTSFEALELPAGFTYGGAGAQNETGDAAGVFYRTAEPFTGGAPFIWNADGSSRLLDRPGNRGSDWAGVIKTVLLTDDGELVVHVIDGEGYFGETIRYANDGTQTILPDVYGEGARLFDANAHGVLLGESSYQGLTIPTVWENDRPIVIADRLVQGPDRLLANVLGINDQSEIVGLARDSAGIDHSVLLRPV